MTHLQSPTGGMRAAVLGSPIAHSLSPVLHTAAYAALGLDWQYESIECDEAALPGVLASLTGSVAGLSLTMPLKEAALSLADEVDDLARATWAANTLIFQRGSVRAYNTDVHGLIASLKMVTEAPTRALLLGAGATGRSALAALGQLGVKTVDVAVRTPARTALLRATGDRLGMSLTVHTLEDIEARLGEVDVVVSTLPPSVADRYAGPVAASRAGVVDVAYAGGSDLVRAARGAGLDAVDGLPMLVHQAAAQVRLMTGSPAEHIEDAMFSAGARAQQACLALSASGVPGVVR